MADQKAPQAVAGQAATEHVGTGHVGTGHVAAEHIGTEQIHGDQRTDRGTRKRVIALIVYGVAFAAFWRLVGLPTDATGAVGWGWLATVCWRIDRPLRDHLRFLRDWLPLTVLLIGYDVSRGYADNGAQPHVHEMIDVDRWLMRGGDVPTVWLQRHLYDPRVIHWYDLVVSWIYFSHFVVTPAVAVVLWLRNRALWLRFTRRWVALSAAGLATYFLFPAAPPWWAGEMGYIAPVMRLSSRGWRLIGLHSAGNVMNAVQDLSNPVAAMPSLHGAFALLVVVFFLPRVRRRWWPLLLAYPAAMAFTLIYCGEHWATDIIVGFGYVGAVYALTAGAEQAWAWWRADRTGVREPD